MERSTSGFEEGGLCRVVGYGSARCTNRRRVGIRGGRAREPSGMIGRTALKLLFGSILVFMLVVTTRATLQQSVFDWGGLVAEPDRWWTIATLADAYCGFLTFYAWVFYKESRVWPRFAWFVAIMLLGNLAMATYMLVQLTRLRAHEPIERLLLRAATTAR